MARTVWSGAISFGLVSVPVKAYTAVREHTVHFHQLEKGSGSRIRYRKVSEKTDREVPNDDIESGYEVSRGSYVIVDPDELEELRAPTTKSVDITDFVRLADVDPVYYASTYWLAPDGDAAERAYRLLLAAMTAEEQVGIGTVVMRNKQYLAAIRPLGQALALSTMHFADEIVDQADIDGLPVPATKPKGQELELAGRIIQSMATDWTPDRYHDTYTEQLRDLIERKAKGETITPEPAAEPDGRIVDLTRALEESLAAARGGSRAPAKKAPARKAATKRAPKKAAGKAAGSRRPTRKSA